MVTFYSFPATTQPGTPLTLQQFVITGDGSTTTLTIDLRHAPVGLAFAGDHFPVLAQNLSGNSLTFSMSGSVMTVTLPTGFSGAVSTVVQFQYA